MCAPVYSTATGLDVAEDQNSFTAERLAGFSKGMVEHIFQEVDADGSGEIDFEELDLLAPFFSTTEWTSEFKEQLFQEMDADEGGSICADEFYEYMIANAKLQVTDDGRVQMEQRQQRLEVCSSSVPAHVMAELDATGAMTIEQKVTHQLHSGFGRTIGDHFVSCYLILKEWGNAEPVCVAAALHAAYQRGDGLQAVDAKTMRAVWKEKLGEEAEELVYLFPSAHKSVYAPDGLLHAPLGATVTFPDVLDGGKPVTITAEQRKALAELEVVNSYDQAFLCNDNPVQNLWQFYQHVTVMPLLSKGAAETVKAFQRRSFCAGVTCEDIVKYHEGRFPGGMDAKWEAYVEMFRPGGRYYDIEKILFSFIDEDGYTQDGCDVLPGRAGGSD